MKRSLLIASTALAISGFNANAQFNLVNENWHLPIVEDYASMLDQTSSSHYTLVDMNGDGMPDMVDAQDNTTGLVWVNGSTPYWKVYLNTGSGFSTSASNWNIPLVEDFADYLDQTSTSHYTLIDMNGDGMPDLVDPQDNTTGLVWVNGSTPYWKVYLNTGSGFNISASNWNIPLVEDFADWLDQTNGSHYSLIDMNGDGQPDLVDAQDNATGYVWINGSTPYWKVYLNTGNGFNLSASNWTIPLVEDYADWLDQTNGTHYSLIDMTGDGKPDLVDAQDNALGYVWLNGSSPYWKVYTNTGNGFNLSATNWALPAVEDYADWMDEVQSDNYGLIDVNGDGKPELIDAQDNATSSVWTSGAPYWKIYINSGANFNLTAENWTIPYVHANYNSMDVIASTGYNLIDMNGDQTVDFVDAQDNNTYEVWVTGSNVPYWKVYLNTTDNSSVATLENSEGIVVYPNPAEDFVNVRTSGQTISTIQLFSSAGELLMEKEASSSLTTIELNELPSGVYIIKAMSENSVATKRVVKN